MMQIEAIQLAFGTGIPRLLSTRVREYYAAVARWLFASDVQLSPIIRDACETLAISAEHAVPIDTVKALIIERLSEEATDMEIDGVILDAGGPEENSLPGNNILSGLEFAVRALLESEPDLQIGILLPTWFSDGDRRPGYETLCEDPRIRFITTNDGRGHGTWFEAYPLDAERFAQARSDAKISPIEVIEKKLIRRIGHYQLPNNQEFFRFFYDGSGCVSEIAQLIRVQIKAHKSDVEHIYYDSHISYWFGLAVTQALWDDPLSKCLQPISNAAIPEEHFNERTLVLLSVVRTGDTIRRLFSDRSPHQGPKVWALLTTEGPSIKKTTQSRRISLCVPDIKGGPSIEVQYALQVQPLATYPRNVFNDLPELAVNPLTEDLSEPFGVAAMWGMIFDAGLQIETPVPPNRRRLGYVPSMGHLAEANGALIAAKVNEVLDSRFGSSLSPTIIFLFPQEEHAERLVETLGVHSRRDTIAVHRQVIQFFSEADMSSNLPLKDLRSAILNMDVGETVAPISDEELDDLFDKLTYLDKQTQSYSQFDQSEIVVIDEFNYTGGTIRGLCKLAHQFGLNVRCSISLASFRKPEGTDHIVPHIPMYELDLDRLIADRGASLSVTADTKGSDAGAGGMRGA